MPLGVLPELCPAVRDMWPFVYESCAWEGVVCTFILQSYVIFVNIANIGGVQWMCVKIIWKIVRSLEKKDNFAVAKNQL